MTHGDRTRYSAVRVCSCGARFVAASQAACASEYDAHQAAAGCGRRR